MNNERLFIKPTTPLALTKEKKETPLSKCVKCFGRGETFLAVYLKPLDLSLAKEVLKCDDNSNEISIDTIAQITAEYYGVDLEDIKGTAKRKETS